jgi:hypothetical protein
MAEEYLYHFSRNSYMEMVRRALSGSAPVDDGYGTVPDLDDNDEHELRGAQIPSDRNSRTQNRHLNKALSKLMGNMLIWLEVQARGLMVLGSDNVNVQVIPTSTAPTVEWWGGRALTVSQGGVDDLIADMKKRVQTNNQNIITIRLPAQHRNTVIRLRNPLNVVAEIPVEDGADRMQLRDGRNIGITIKPSTAPGTWVRMKVVDDNRRHPIVKHDPDQFFLFDSGLPFVPEQVRESLLATVAESEKKVTEAARVAEAGTADVDRVTAEAIDAVGKEAARVAEEEAAEARRLRRYFNHITSPQLVLLWLQKYRLYVPPPAPPARMSRSNPHTQDSPIMDQSEEVIKDPHTQDSPFMDQSEEVIKDPNKHIFLLVAGAQRFFGHPWFFNNRTVKVWGLPALLGIDNFEEAKLECGPYAHARGNEANTTTEGIAAQDLRSPLLGPGSRGGGKRKSKKSKKSKKIKSKRRRKSKRRNKSKKSKRRRTRRHIR